jgi:hypothetical protein
MQKKLWQYKLFVVAINYQQMAKIFVEQMHVHDVKKRMNIISSYISNT